MMNLLYFSLSLDRNRSCPSCDQFNGWPTDLNFEKVGPKMHLKEEKAPMGMDPIGALMRVNMCGPMVHPTHHTPLPPHRCHEIGVFYIDLNRTELLY